MAFSADILKINPKQELERLSEFVIKEVRFV